MAKKSAMEKGVDTISYIRILLSPAMIFAVIGFILKIYFEGNKGNLLFGITVAVGTLVGILWAEKVRRKMGTTNFISKVDASPDLDDLGK